MINNIHITNKIISDTSTTIVLLTTFNECFFPQNDDLELFRNERAQISAMENYSLSRENILFNGRSCCFRNCYSNFHWR